MTPSHRAAAGTVAPLLLAAPLLLLAGAGLRAQHAAPPPPAAHALEGVTVIRAAGDTLRDQTLVIRDGRIERLATGAEPPPDARRLEGDSLRVYPGLVDAWGEPRFEFPDDGEGDEGDAEEGDGGERVSWDPTRAQQGFTPHRRVADHLTDVGEDFEKAREAGVVASGLLPEDGLAPGRGAVVLHRLGSERAEATVLRPELGPVLSFDGASGVYPGTLFGVVAFLRQRFADAGHHARLVAARSEDPRGLPAGSWDPDLDVLRAAATGAVPVYFRADGAEDIRRVLDLAAELGFRPVIVGGEEAWKVADRLRAADVPVLVSLDFPKPERWKPDEEEDEEEDEAGEEEPGQTAAETGAEAQEAELEPEVLREKRRIEAVYANAGRLAEAGVPFALTSGGGDAELIEGARKAIEYGLRPEDALAALTVTPAELLGVPGLPRIGRDLPANLLVTDGPLFDEGTHVLYTFVEGRPERGFEPGAEPEEPPAVDLTGTWEVEISSGGGTFEGTMEVEQDGARFEGSFTTQFGEAEVVDGVVSGSDVSFTLLLGAGGQSFEMSLSGSAEGDEMSGSGSGPPQMGSFTWEASRSGPGGEEG